jgi:glycosyltransferase involved in cell wall biosynthesis
LAPLRIVQVIWALGLGGAEQVVIRLAAGLDRSRFEPLICCLDEPGAFAAQAERQGVEVVALGKRGPGDVRVLGRLRGLLRRRRIDVVHTHLWGADFWGRLGARLAGTAAIVSTAHNVDLWKRWYHIALDRGLARWTSDLVAVSGQVRDFYESQGVGNGRWNVIHNGVAEAAGRPRGRSPVFRELGIRDEDPVVALIGRLVAAKAPEIFLEAVAKTTDRIPTLRAMVVGDGPLRSEMEQRAQRLGLQQRVAFTGVRHDVPELLAGVDVLAFSSRVEGLSIAMLEAMSAEVPVVATRVGGTPELIESGESGILVPPEDPQALADGLVAILGSPERARSIACAGRARVRERFSERRMVQAYEELYGGARPRAAVAASLG